MSPCSSPAPPASLYQSCDLSRPPPLLPSPNPGSGGHGVVSMTTILKSGPLGPSPGEVLDGAAGHGGPWVKGQGWGKDVKWVSEMSAQLGGSPMPSVVGTIPLVSQVQSLGRGGGSVRRGGPAQSTREGSCPGGVLDTCQCLQPTGGSLGFWGGDEFLKHNVLWVEPKKGRCQGPQHWHPRSTSGVSQPRHRGTGRRRVLWLCPCRAEHSAGQRWAVCRSCRAGGAFCFLQAWSCFRR